MVVIKNIAEDFRGIYKQDVNGVAIEEISIMNNISEDYERRGNTEFHRFLTIAKGSCGELRNMLYIAEDLKYLSESDADNYRIASLNITKGIAALMRHLKKDASQSKT